MPPEIDADAATEATEPEGMEGKGRERARKAKRRTKRRKKQREEKPPEETEGEWFVPPSAEKVEGWIRGGLEKTRVRFVRDLEKVVDLEDPIQAADLDAFRTHAVVGEVEVWCLATGISGLAHKYRLLILNFAPEILTSAGLCFLAYHELRLRALRGEIIARWKKQKSRSSSSSAPGEAESPHSSGTSLAAGPAV